MPGVIAVVRDGSFLGVVAEREEQAIKARKALIDAAKWTGGSELPDPARLHEQLMALPTQSSVVSEKQAVAATAAKTLEAAYTRPYIAHASIGPSCAVAEFNDGGLTVWTHSQGVFPLRRDLAKALKLGTDLVRCVHLEGSGCYGHNGADDVALDAALLARAAAGRPVRLQWMRDDEFAWEPYGAAMLARAKASLDASGKMSTGPMRFGAIRIAPDPRHRARTTICSPAGMSPSRANPDLRPIFRSPRAAATVMRCRSTTFPISAW
jgi:CO/xanthine dehydrogenase Mo-binding subunit